MNMACYYIRRKARIFNLAVFLRQGEKLFVTPDKGIVHLFKEHPIQ